MSKIARVFRSMFEPDYRNYSRHSYSQEGEDLILVRLFDALPESKPGFCVDIGAHHPFRFSNTFMFYEMGWRGINVDAMPGSMAIFNSCRSRDINIEAAVSDTAENLTYYIFNEPALNGFCEKLANERDGLKTFRIIERKSIFTRTLESLLTEYLPANQHVDFMSVDVEGFDLKVLMSNDWSRYRPEILLVEDSKTGNISGAVESDLTKYLEKQEYEFCAKAVHTMFFRDMRK